MAQYRLLRNNKESGPYTKEQLIEMGLKAYDLVWADGKSAAWRYPSEVPELKAYAPEVEEQPFDRFYKKKEPKAVKEAVETITTAKKEKPRFRVKADSRKIEPVTTTYIAEQKPAAEVVLKAPETVRVQVKEPVSATPDWKDVYADWQHTTPGQKKTTQLPVGEIEEEPVIETKFSESLSSIKERYVEAVLKPKENAKATAFSFDKRYIAAAVAIPLLCIAMWLGYKYSNNATKPDVAEVQPQNILSGQQPSTEKVTEQPVTEPGQDAPTDNALSNPEENKQIVTTTTADRKKESQPSQAKSLTNEKDGAVATKPTVVVPEAKKPVEKLSSEKPANTAASNKANTAGANADNVFASVPATKPPVNPPAKSNTGNTSPVVNSAPKTASKRIEDYIVVTKADRTKGTVENMHLSVSNVTDFPIDLAVVDVEYFDASGKYQKGETVYVKKHTCK